MASTNKTTNYQLSQFSPTDKPAWLGDYNQDMSKIDAGMHTNASDIDTVETTVSTLQTAVSGNTSSIETLQTSVGTNTSDIADLKTADTTLDGKITTAQNTADRADGKADTNASNIASQATQIASLESESQSQDASIRQNASNISNLSNEIQALIAGFTLSDFDTTTNIGSQYEQVKISLAQSEDSEIFKVYGKFWLATSGSAKTVSLSAISGLSGYYGIKTSLKLNVAPTQAYVIDGACCLTFRFPANNGTSFEQYAQSIAIDNEGYIYVDVSTNNSFTLATYSARFYYLPPCVYFNTNFGDEPSPQPNA